MRVSSAAAPAEAGAAAGRGREVVAVRGVSKSFGEAHALRSCSFSARAGEVHAIVGENGSGKSTLAKLLAGVLHPDAGSVSVNGARPTSPRAAKALGIAVVFQEILIAEGGTVLDNVFLGDDGLFRASMSQRHKRARAQELLSSVIGSPVDLHATVENLPLSARQWIVIVRALLREPRVVVFDESTAALDHASVERFFGVVRRLRDSGACVVIVTHRIHELTAICDRATVLSDGIDVGTLAGGEITEARLLELMRSEVQPNSAQREELAQAARAADVRTEAALTVHGLRLDARAAPIDLSVQSTEIVGLAGLEGQGQVEFIQTITGFRRPAAGHVHVNRAGQRHAIVSAKSAEQAQMAYIPGERKSEGLFPNLSVFENFGIPCYRRTARAGFLDRRRVRSMFLAQVENLSIRLGRPNAPIDSLSGGNQQKVVVGRSLAARPLVIALNDPTRGVDIGAKRDLYALLRTLAAQGKAILFLSNEIEELAGLCHRVVVFRQQTVFTTLATDRITSEAILAAMFGYSEC